MSNYFLNLKLWYTGWDRFHEIEKWKPGWGPTERKWFLMYGTTYLLCVLVLAGPVASTSFYLGKYFNVPGDHFANAGEPLFGSVRSPPWVRIVVPALWALLLWGAV